jgi:hypothetical protein
LYRRGGRGAGRFERNPKGGEEQAMMVVGHVTRCGTAWVAIAMGALGVGVTGAAWSRSYCGDAAEPGSKPTAQGVTRQAQAADSTATGDLVVHEWGTFLGMNASDGTPLDGMYHEEHALPEFVHSRSHDQLRLPWMLLKGETPVIYFYTPRTVRVRVGVGFPRGIWTQWYPQAARVQPSLSQQAEAPDRQSDGRICWIADVIPSSAVPIVAPKERGAVASPVFGPPPTSAGALWDFARDVDAALVNTIDRTGQAERAEYEKFLFYRGLGQGHLPVKADARHGGTLALEADPTLGQGIEHILVVRVEGGRGAFRYRPALRPGEEASGVIPSMDESQPLAKFTDAVAGILAEKLTESGLYPKEARAMVNTWKTSYLQSEGIRILFVLPQSWTDAFIPISIVPAPRQIVRVMVGRLELLSAEREQLAEAAIQDLAGRDMARRHRAFEYLREQGRYVEPIIRRIDRTTGDSRVRTICRRLLATELVTELRAAIHNASDGTRVVDDPLLIRAHLGRLLREIGMTAEAKVEGVAVWAAIRSRGGPPSSPAADDAGSLELQAAAFEASGNDRRAAELYARRIDGYVRSLKGVVPPSQIAWIRDWWVGRAYVSCMERSGKAGATVEALIPASRSVVLRDFEPSRNRQQ